MSKTQSQTLELESGSHTAVLPPEGELEVGATGIDQG